MTGWGDNLKSESIFASLKEQTLLQYSRLRVGVRTVSYSHLKFILPGMFSYPLIFYRDFYSCYSHFMPYLTTPSVSTQGYRSSLLLYYSLGAYGLLLHLK